MNTTNYNRHVGGLIELTIFMDFKFLFSKFRYKPEMTCLSITYNRYLINTKSGRLNTS